MGDQGIAIYGLVATEGGIVHIGAVGEVTDLVLGAALATQAIDPAGKPRGKPETRDGAS